jgi:polyisoprenoid-binding protein YceI
VKKKARPFLLVISAVAWAAASGATFDLDPSKTEINFTLHDPLHTVHGTFNLKRGSIQLDPETGKASGEMVIDVPSGISGNGSRDKRMHKEILESQKYPEAVFTPDRVRGHIAPEGTSEIDVHGNFRIHGAEHEITVHFQVQANGSQYIATGTFTIPYVQWGMKNPSNFLLKVDDKVEMDVRAEAAEKR